jgi:hypothetical protein
MTKLLQEAIAKVLERPEQDQDMAAQMLLTLVEEQNEPEDLDAETLAAVEEGWQQSERGEVIPEAEMAEFFRRLGV